MAKRLRAIHVFAVLWLAVSLASAQTAFKAVWTGLSHPPAVTRLDEFMDRVAAEVPGHVEVALWWPDRSESGLATLAHWWASASYRLAPRRVYPLLTVEEAFTVEPLLDRLRPFLAERGELLARGEAATLGATAGAGAEREAEIVIAVWGESCDIEGFPSLEVFLRESRGCLLRPRPSASEEAP